MFPATIATLRLLSAWMVYYAVALAVILLLMHYSSAQRMNTPRMAFVLMLPLIVTFANYPINYAWYGIDYILYASNFETSTTLSMEGSERLFALLTFLIRQVTDNVAIYFAITSSLYIAIYIWACHRLTHGVATLSQFVLCFGGPFFIAYMNNTLRAGLALSLVLLAISFVNESRWRAAFIALCAINIHFSTAVPLIALLIAYRYPRPRWFLCVWVLAIFVSLAAGSSFATFFGSMIEDSRVDRYLLIDADEAAAVYRVGFRWDFVAYSLIPMIVGWFYINKLHCADVLYRIILCTYLIANAFWILVIRVPFSDRFAYLSWFLIPILLGYPLLQQRVAMPRQRVYYSTLLALSILLKLYILG